MKKNKKGLVLSISGIIGLIIITVGVTYAFFNYVKQGTTENSITTGTITFLYTETSGVGRGISLSDAYPISDEVGKAQTGEGNVFDFKVTSTTSTNSSIPYEITARKKDTSTLDESVVKLYLTKVSGDSEEEVLLDNYSNLTQTTKVSADKYIEKTLYTSKVPSNTANYEQAYRLRMWIDEDTDFSPVEDSDGNITYPYNDKEFTVTVNVYANAKVVTDEDIANESKAEISSLSVNGTELTAVTDQDYDYEITLDEGTTSALINVETISEYATVTVERIDSLAYETSNIKRLSAKKTLDLNSGDNYFKITVTSGNKEVENEYKIKISVVESVTIFGKTFSVIQAEPTLTTTSQETNESGLYKSTATNDGSPTYYFRGNVENNYVDFAGFTWRVVRINEDGTIRIVMQDGISSNNKYAFNPTYNNKLYMYYSESAGTTTETQGVKYILDNWYNTNIASNESYASKLATGDYFCEEAKVAVTSTYAANSGASMVVYSSYNPTFKCSTDENGKGIVSASVGLITYDEAVYAGAYYGKFNSSYYLYNGTYFLTMSPAGFSGSIARVWIVNSSGFPVDDRVTNPAYYFRAVLNLKADTIVTGLGTSTSPWVVQE